MRNVESALCDGVSERMFGMSLHFVLQQWAIFS